MGIALLSKHLVFSELILLSREEVQASLLIPTLLPEAGTWAAQEQVFPATAEGKETFLALGLFPVFCHEWGHLPHVPRRPSSSFVFHWLQMSPEHLFLLLVTSVWSYEKNLAVSSPKHTETQLKRAGCGPNCLSSPEWLKPVVSAFPHIFCALSVGSPGRPGHLL